MDIITRQKPREGLLGYFIFLACESESTISITCHLIPNRLNIGYSYFLLFPVFITLLQINLLSYYRAYIYCMVYL